jgi:hypothetical protein
MAAGNFPGRQFILYASFINLAYIFTLTAEVVIEVLRLYPLRTPLYLIELPLGIMVYLGWISLGKNFKNAILLGISLIAIIIFPVQVILDIILLESTASTLAYAVALLLVTGTISMIFGVSLLKMKDALGDLATACGIVNIMAGICSASIILVYLAIALSFPLAIMESALLYRAYRRLEGEPKGPGAAKAHPKERPEPPVAKGKKMAANKAVRKNR